jgi:POT family proton-dependent oligopeptide transporter
VYFGFLFTVGGFTREEKNRIVAIIIFYLAAALFWSAFEQAGSTFTLFADRNTDNRIFGFEFPSTAWQSINALFIIVLSGVFAWLWLKLNSIKKEPSTPMKFAIGLALVGVGFLILVPAAAMIEKTGEKVGIIWLLMVYFIHTVGELFLSPVGLSAMTKLAPARIVGQMMGIWFLGAATGNFIGGRVGGMFETFPIKYIFLAVFGTSLFFALVMFFLVPWMKRLMGDTR